MMDALLAASANLLSESADPSNVYLIDALLPGYHFLFGLYPVSRVASYTNDLFEALSPLNPVIIYLKSQVNSAFARAIAERGSGWLDQFLARINRHYRTAGYVRVWLPLRSEDDVCAFFEEMDRFMLKMINEWRGRHIVIDTTGRTIGEIQAILHDSFNLQGGAC